MTKVFAHRGANREAPENTLPAFEKALAKGVDGVELDVQFSADGEIMVMHDEKLGRTVNSTGLLHDYTYKQLREMDASYGFPGYAGVQIPTLAEVLDLFQRTSIQINIELKNSIVEYPGLEDAVIALVDRLGMMDQVVLSSFSPGSVRLLHAMEVSCPVGMLWEYPGFRQAERSVQLGADSVHPVRFGVYSDLWVRKAHRLGLAVRVWTVDSVEELKKFYRWGVEAVITNEPDRAMELRG
ncbi:MAG: hypothetical protein LBR21_08125 [Propionibacteriaceae bacterium]|jgi:glycerophosphoryl diester phosphodiesterase|nr:hypothetical protein [Propionibacteriaceae bacterium]